MEEPLPHPYLGNHTIIMIILIISRNRFPPPGARYDPVSPLEPRFHPGRGPSRGQRGIGLDMRGRG